MDKFFVRYPKNGIDSEALVESMPGNVASQWAHAWDYFTEIHKQYYVHEICITLKPKWHNENTLYVYGKVKDKVRKWFDSWSHFEPYYIFVPEYTEMGILHFHGILHFKKEHEYLCAETKKKFNKTFGITKGKEVHKMDNYIRYIQKDISKQNWQIKPFGNVPKPKPPQYEEDNNYLPIE